MTKASTAVAPLDLEAVGRAATEDALQTVRAGFRPPRDITVSQWADLELEVTTGPLTGTRWQTDFAPYQRGILDVFHEPGVEIAVVMGSSQWGKTACAVCVSAYHIAEDPCPILVVEPTVKPMAEDFAKNRLDPVIAASPVLRERVAKKRQKDSSNTILLKTFRGGSLAVGGANSAASLAARTIRLLILDEIDRYPPELPGEGSTIAIVLKRTTAYRRRRRVLMLSSPTLKGAPIERWHARGDQRRYFVPCPGCGHMHPYEWRNVRWTNHDPTTARLHCPACDYAIDDAERVAILERGEWRPAPFEVDADPTERPEDVEEGEEEPEGAAEAVVVAQPEPVEPEEPRDPAIVSFHLWEAYSPLSSLVEIVKSFLAARKAQKAGDNSEMHTWVNTTLGMPLEPDSGEGVEPHVLLMRREHFHGTPEVGDDVDIPAGACCLTMGVDVQDDRLEILVFGWGPGEESWLVDRQTLAGDTSQDDPWKALDEVLDHQYLHASGQRLGIQATCIDSAGHRTTLVYDYAARQAARRVYAVIGRDGQRPLVSSPSPRKWGRQQRKVPLYTVGVDAAKALLVSRLKLTRKGPGYVHIPHADWADDELANQLTSERLVTVFSRGVPRQVWRKVRPRNEALDCAVYGLAALRLFHPNLKLLAERLAGGGGGGPAAPPRAPQRRGWLGDRPRGRWLR